MQTDAITTVWQGQHLRVQKCGRWEYVERTSSNGGVIIVAVTPSEELLLVQQYRVPLAREVIELPAGLAGDSQAGEELVEAARRELLEETGYEAGGWAFLTCGPSSPGLTNEVNSFFLATQLRCVGSGGGDEHEKIRVHRVPIGQVRAWLGAKLEEGIAVDPKVYVGLFFALQQIRPTTDRLQVGGERD